MGRSQFARVGIELLAGGSQEESFLLLKSLQRHRQTAHIRGSRRQACLLVGKGRLQSTAQV
ncbi:hypothetical protein, partial [Enterobacter hormaechei]|uniref:hypothetical protein n=1 Tax=Enterobacter hormaechei TaxID=158836 RepID=UPI001953A14C